MAARANWKGFLRLSLVSCPIALYPATSEREKIRFHQLNRKTGNRIKMQRTDAETGKPVEFENIVKGYEIEKGHNVEITDEELQSVELDSTRVIDIEEFVPRKEIDDRFIARPYYIAPDEEAGVEAFATIRDVIERNNMVALGKVVLSTREHVIALEPRGKGLVGLLLRFPYEVRDEKEYFDDIPNVRVTADMLDLASHIVKQKSGHFRPDQFEDRYENALRKLIEAKEKGKKIDLKRPSAPRPTGDVMEALRQSLRVIEGGLSERGGSSPRRASARKTTRSAATRSRRRAAR
jgi:DNA end-binding protein Ku